MSDRSELLLGKALSGTLEPAEADELERLLAADPALADAFREEARLHALLPLAVEEGGDRFERSLRARVRALSDSSRFLRAVRRARHRGDRRSPVPALAAAAAVLAVAGLLAFAGTRRPAAPIAVARPAPAPAAPAPVPPPPAPAPARPADPDEGRKVEEEMRRQIERDRPKSAPPAPAPAPPPPAPRETRAAVAVVERVEGDVRRNDAALRPGEAWTAGAPLATGADGRATLAYPDGTRVSVGPAASIREAGAGGAKRIAVDRGAVDAEVAPQAEGRPMVFASRHADAVVLGTTLRFEVGPDGTRLDVSRGRVRLGRPDGSAVEVPARCFAFAAPGRPLEAGSPDARTLSFRDGAEPSPAYAGTRDTTLTERPGIRPAGGQPTLRGDGNLAETTDDQSILLRWDLAALPAGGTVIAASIEVWVAEPSGGQAYELYRLRRAWSEAAATWELADRGAPWERPGALGAADRDPELLGALAPRAVGPHRVVLGPAALRVIECWVARPETNHGFIVSNGERQDGFVVDSRESRTADRRPRLSVTILPPAK